MATAVTPVLAFERSTDGIAARERPEFWTANAGGRMRSTLAAEAARPPKARLRGISGAGGDFLDYWSEGMWMDRTPAMCATDGQDQLSLGLVLGASTGAAQNGRDLLMRRGDLYLIDFARPVRSLVLNHHELAINLPRRKVIEVAGPDIEKLGGRRLVTGGIGTLLASHMRATSIELPRLSAEEREVAINTACDLALATLQAAMRRLIDLDRFADSLYIAARTMIDEQCGDPYLSPAKLIALLNCSRAGLYRVFARQGDSVAAAIWDARLERARRILASPSESGVSLAEIAFRCGFLDQSTFSRMFKRRYGLTPREARPLS